MRYVRLLCYSLLIVTRKPIVKKMTYIRIIMHDQQLLYCSFPYHNIYYIVIGIAIYDSQKLNSTAYVILGFLIFMLSLPVIYNLNKYYM